MPQDRMLRRHLPPSFTRDAHGEYAQFMYSSIGAMLDMEMLRHEAALAIVAYDRTQALAAHVPPEVAAPAEAADGG